MRREWRINYQLVDMSAYFFAFHHQIVVQKKRNFVELLFYSVCIHYTFGR